MPGVKDRVAVVTGRPMGWAARSAGSSRGRARASSSVTSTARGVERTAADIAAAGGAAVAVAGDVTEEGPAAR